MTKILFDKKYDAVIENIIVKDEELTLFFDGGKIELRSYHSQDCCEQVYADFSVMTRHVLALVGKNIHSIVVKGIKDMGFLLCIADEKIFIACYDNQNGYYSSALSLQIEDVEGTTEIDLGECVEHSDE